MLIYERLMISSDPFEVQVWHIYASCTHPHFSFPIFSFATHRSRLIEGGQNILVLCCKSFLWVLVFSYVNFKYFILF